jgi:hypothetical protein
LIADIKSWQPKTANSLKQYIIFFEVPGTAANAGWEQPFSEALSACRLDAPVQLFYSLWICFDPYAMADDGQDYCGSEFHSRLSR